MHVLTKHLMIDRPTRLGDGVLRLDVDVDPCLTTPLGLGGVVSGIQVRGVLRLRRQPGWLLKHITIYNGVWVILLKRHALHQLPPVPLLFWWVGVTNKHPVVRAPHGNGRVPLKTPLKALHDLLWDLAALVEPGTCQLQRQHFCNVGRRIQRAEKNLGFYVTKLEVESGVGSCPVAYTRVRWKPVKPRLQSGIFQLSASITHYYPPTPPVSVYSFYLLLTSTKYLNTARYRLTTTNRATHYSEWMVRSVEPRYCRC